MLYCKKYYWSFFGARGITGRRTARGCRGLFPAVVKIRDSYSTGYVAHNTIHAGGICGCNIDDSGGIVYIKNVYRLVVTNKS